MTDKHYLIRAETLSGCVEAAKELNFDLSEALSDSNLTIAQLTKSDSYINFLEAAHFLERAAELSHCESFGLLVAMKQPELHLGLVSQLVKVSATLGKAIEGGIELNKLVNEAALWQLELDGKYAHLVRYVRQTSEHKLPQIAVLSVAAVFKALTSLLGPRWRPNYIYYSHAAPNDIRLYERFFKSPIRFDQRFNGIIFPSSDLAHPIKTADQALYEIVRSYLYSVQSQLFVDEEDIVTRVDNHIKKTLGSNECNLRATAQVLGTHPRALQRALKAKNLTFKELLTSTRLKLARQYLQGSEIALVELAFLLGYKDASAFSRAFKNAFGISPDHWRRASRLQEEPPLSRGNPPGL